MIENSLGTPEDDSWHSEAARKLRTALKERGELVNLRKAVQTARFWESQHFTFGMAIRNWLRTNGYDEDTLKVWNLDDHYINVMLLAVGFQVEGGYRNSDLEHLEKRLVPVLR